MDPHQEGAQAQGSGCRPPLHPSGGGTPLLNVRMRTTGLRQTRPRPPFPAESRGEFIAHILSPAFFSPNKGCDACTKIRYCGAKTEPGLVGTAGEVGGRRDKSLPSGSDFLPR